jgi:hypothetical protein
MKNVFFTLSFLIVHFFIFGQAPKNINTIQRNEIFKTLSGHYINCEVGLGNARGVGSITFGNPNGSNYSQVNDFKFSINVLGRNDIQFGKMTNTQIETQNFNDYTIRIQWNNNRTDQGTISAEIQILYSFTKTKYESYFINNSSSNFKIFWWTELDESQKQALKNSIITIYQTEIKRNKMDADNKKRREDSLKLVKQNLSRKADSIFLIKQREKELVLTAKGKYDDSVQLNKKNY